ncbi:MAG: hypothetical protein ABI674_04825 [Spartobacteria bacterium]
MNLILATEILKAAEADPTGCLEVHGRKMLHEAALMRDAGWLELAKTAGAHSTTVARVTETGHQISRLFQADAVAQRLRDAFMPRTAGD